MLKDYKARGLRWAVDYDCKRVRALAVYDSKDVSIRGLTIKRPGFWSLAVIYSEQVTDGWRECARQLRWLWAEYRRN